jgi:hypothetical protein
LRGELLFSGNGRAAVALRASVHIKIGTGLESVAFNIPFEWYWIYPSEVNLFS